MTSYSSVHIPAGPSAVIYPTLHVYLGACSNFALIAGNTITFSSVLTIISNGSIASTSGGSITGNYQLNSGTTQLSSSSYSQCTTDFSAASTAASNKICTTTFATAELSGKTLGPGVYCSTPGTLSIAAGGFLVLDGGNTTSKVWVFQAATTLITRRWDRCVLPQTFS